MHEINISNPFVKAFINFNVFFWIASKECMQCSMGIFSVVIFLDKR